MNKEDLDNYYHQDFSSKMLKRVNNILITEEEINTLNRYNINIDNCNSFQELILVIKTYLDESDCYYSEDLIDLEDLHDRLCERDYYENSNK